MEEQPYGKRGTCNWVGRPWHASWIMVLNSSISSDPEGDTAECLTAH